MRCQCGVECVDNMQAAALAREETPQNPPQQAAHGGMVPQAGPGATADTADASAHGGELLGAASPRRDSGECEAAGCPMMPMDLFFVRLWLRQLQQHTAVPGCLRGPAAVKLESDLLTEPHLLRDDNLLADSQRVHRGQPTRLGCRACRVKNLRSRGVSARVR